MQKTSTNPSRQPGPKSPSWKGGRVVASNGYILIKVGLGHHLADVRGYAYEHRLVAEKNVGRRLEPGEMIHHVDGNKQNNDPVNIVVKANAAHHLVEHRMKGCNRQLPDEPNQSVSCECGCGTVFLKFDLSKRPRRFVSGHNLRECAS